MDKDTLILAIADLLMFGSIIILYVFGHNFIWVTVAMICVGMLIFLVGLGKS